MPRLRNLVTGVTVEVSEETAELLGSGWEPLPAPGSAEEEVAPEEEREPSEPPPRRRRKPKG